MACRFRVTGYDRPSRGHCSTRWSVLVGAMSTDDARATMVAARCRRGRRDIKIVRVAQVLPARRG